MMSLPSFSDFGLLLAAAAPHFLAEATACILAGAAIALPLLTPRFGADRRLLGHRGGDRAQRAGGWSATWR